MTFMFVAFILVILATAAGTLFLDLTNDPAVMFAARDDESSEL